MGYTTEFSGSFKLDKPLTIAHYKQLVKFSETRHDYEPGCPGIWCDWTPNKDGTAIQWNEGEKFYYYVEWLQYLIENFLYPWGYSLKGKVSYQGEDQDDFGDIYVDGAYIKKVPGVKVSEIPSWYVEE